MPSSIQYCDRVHVQIDNSRGGQNLTEFGRFDYCVLGHSLLGLFSFFPCFVRDCH